MAGNHTVIKRFSDNYYSVTQMKYPVRDCIPCSGKDLFQEKQKHEEKARENLIRSRTNIFELAMCNEWEYFATFTIDKTKYDRYNLANYYKDFAKFINNMNTTKKCNIKYLLIPEMHQDGAWHLHGLFMGIPDRQLVPFRLEDKIPKYIRTQIKRGFKV